MISYITDSDFCGQRRVKDQINFYLHGARNGGIFPPLLLSQRRGDGKTALARLIGQNLVHGTKPRKFIEVNGASVKRLDNFINQLVLPHVVDSFCTLFLDECDQTNKEVMDWLLSAVAPNNENKAIVSYQDSSIEFDYTKFAIILASTNAEKLRLAMLSRLTRIEFESYKDEDLIKILKKNSGDITYKDGVETEIVGTCRESPRAVVKMAKENISTFCTIEGKHSFNNKDWLSIKKLLNIQPFGLLNNEIQLLKLLSKRGPMTLTALAAAMGLDTTTVRRDIELFLLKKNLISIVQKRQITMTGQNLLKEIF